MTTEMFHSVAFLPSKQDYFMCLPFFIHFSQCFLRPFNTNFPLSIYPFYLSVSVLFYTNHILQVNKFHIGWSSCKGASDGEVNTKLNWGPLKLFWLCTALGNVNILIWSAGNSDQCSNGRLRCNSTATASVLLLEGLKSLNNWLVEQIQPFINILGIILHCCWGGLFIYAVMHYLLF